MFLSLDIPPGVVRLGTEYQSAGRWYDSNLCRWVDGVLRPIGGWAALTGPSLSSLVVSGAARGCHAWKVSTAPYMVIGTHTNLYSYTGTDLFNITPAGLAAGRADSSTFGGYGIGPYGRGTYGTPRFTNNVDLATTWQFDNFGDDLLAVNSDDGRLLRWQGNVLVAAAPVVASAGTVPTGNSGVVVTEERFAMLLGAGADPRRVAWPNQEDYTNWQVTATTQAGDYRISTPGRIRCGRRVRRGVLILTDLDAHLAQFVGRPGIYGFERVGTGCGIVSPHAVAVEDDFAVWMGQGSFYTFDGTVRPLPCAVRDYVFTDLNHGQLEKVFALRVPRNKEIWWFYPSAASSENNRYVAFNYTDNVWSIGALSRTTGVATGVWPNQVYVGSDGIVYQHEVGTLYDGATPYVESGPVELGDGSNVYRLTRLIPDERTQGQAQARFRTRLYPNGAPTSSGPFSLANPTSLRITGRQISVRIEGATGSDWRVGRWRFSAVPLGTR